MRPFLPVDSVARFLRMSPSWVRQQIRKGELIAHGPKGHELISETGLSRFMRMHRVRPRGRK